MAVDDKLPADGGSTVVAAGNTGGPNPPTKPDFSSPYFLSSNDNPGNIITPIVLRGPNYDEWSKSIRLSLISRRKVSFLEGTAKKPTDDAGIEDWRCLQAMLVQWVLNTVDASLKKTFPYFEEIFPLWEMLKKRFHNGNGTRKQDLKKALAACKQTGSMTMEDYFGLLQPLWDELATLTPIPSCTCGGCICNLGAQFQALREEDQFHDFMYGLDEKYSSTRSSLLAQEPLPSLDRSYQTLRREENLKKAKAEPEIDNQVALALQTPSRLGSNNGGSVKHGSSRSCSYCKKPGHDVETCFQKNGYPEWWESLGKRGAAAGPKPKLQPNGGGATVAALLGGRGLLRALPPLLDRPEFREGMEEFLLCLLNNGSV